MRGFFRIREGLLRPPKDLEDRIYQDTILKVGTLMKEHILGILEDIKGRITDIRQIDMIRPVFFAKLEAIDRFVGREYKGKIRGDFYSMYPDVVAYTTTVETDYDKKEMFDSIRKNLSTNLKRYAVAPTNDLKVSLTYSNPGDDESLVGGYQPELNEMIVVLPGSVLETFVGIMEEHPRSGLAAGTLSRSYRFLNRVVKPLIRDTIKHELTHAVQNYTTSRIKPPSRRGMSTLDAKVNKEHYYLSAMEFQPNIATLAGNIVSTISDNDTMRRLIFGIDSSAAKKTLSPIVRNAVDSSDFMEILRKHAPRKYKTALKYLYVELDRWITDEQKRISRRKR